MKPNQISKQKPLEIITTQTSQRFQPNFCKENKTFVAIVFEPSNLTW